MRKGARSHFLCPALCTEAWCRWVHSSHARGLRAAHLVSTSVRVWVCVHIQKGKGRGLGVCLFTGDTVRHPPRCSRSRREQDALTLTYTFGAWKPQSRQQRVHRGWVGGGAMEAGCAGVHQHVRAGQQSSVVSSPATPHPQG